MFSACFYKQAQFTRADKMVTVHHLHVNSDDTSNFDENSEFILILYQTE